MLGVMKWVMEGINESSKERELLGIFGYCVEACSLVCHQWTFDSMELCLNMLHVL